MVDIQFKYMINTNIPQFMGELKEIIECPACQKSLRNAHADILLYNEEGQTFHMTCPICRSGSIIRVSLDINKPFVRILLTDISSDDINSCYTKDIISSNDVLEVFNIVGERITDELKCPHCKK